MIEKLDLSEEQRYEQKCRYSGNNLNSYNEGFTPNDLLAGLEDELEARQDVTIDENARKMADYRQYYD